MWFGYNIEEVMQCILCILYICTYACAMSVRTYIRTFLQVSLRVSPCFFFFGQSTHYAIRTFLLSTFSLLQEARTMKAIAQLKKDSLKKDNIIKSLETEQKRREVVLKRKQEEVVTLRKMKLVSQPALRRPPSVSTVSVVMREGSESGKGAFNINRRKSSIFSSESARTSWRNMERKVCGMYCMYVVNTYVHMYVCAAYSY